MLLIRRKNDERRYFEINEPDGRKRAGADPWRRRWCVYHYQP